MFDKLIREIERIGQGVKIPVEAPLDEDGYYDRLCPYAECNFQFKVLFEDWENKVSDDHVYCPFCRHDQPSSEWDTPEQSKYFEAAAVAYVKNSIDNAMKDDARRFNQRQNSGFITMKLSVKPASPTFVLPAKVAKVMQQQLTCEACNCRFAVIGAAFFCPACGHNSVVATFNQTVETVRQIIKELPSVRSLLETNFNEDTAASSVRTMLEDSMTRLVGAFQQFSEGLFNTLPNSNAIKQPKNVFQRLTDASALWRTVTGNGYEDLLMADELRELKGLFQKRHLLAHRNGIVDQEYIDKSGDTTYAVGQRLVIKETTVSRLADLLTKLSQELRKLV